MHMRGHMRGLLRNLLGTCTSVTCVSGTDDPRVPCSGGLGEAAAKRMLGRSCSEMENGDSGDASMKVYGSTVALQVSPHGTVRSSADAQIVYLRTEEALPVHHPLHLLPLLH